MWNRKGCPEHGLTRDHPQAPKPDKHGAPGVSPGYWCGGRHLARPVETACPLPSRWKSAAPTPGGGTPTSTSGEARDATSTTTQRCDEHPPDESAGVPCGALTFSSTLQAVTTSAAAFRTVRAMSSNRSTSMMMMVRPPAARQTSRAVRRSAAKCFPHLSPFLRKQRGGKLIDCHFQSPKLTTARVDASL